MKMTTSVLKNTLLCLLLGAISLNATAKGNEVPGSFPAKYIQQKHEYRKANCKKSSCPRVSVQLDSLEQYPALNAQLDSKIVGLLSPSTKFSSIAAFSSDFVKNSGTGAWLTLEKSVIRQQWPLITFRISTAVYYGKDTGEAEEDQFWYVYDVRQQKALKLPNLILPGREKPFRQVYEQQFRLMVQQKIKDAETAMQIPFVETDDFMLDADCLRLHYNGYAIDGFGASEAELCLPYAKLKGILDPVWLSR